MPQVQSYKYRPLKGAGHEIFTSKDIAKRSYRCLVLASLGSACTTTKVAKRELPDSIVTKLVTRTLRSPVKSVQILSHIRKDPQTAPEKKILATIGAGEWTIAERETRQFLQERPGDIGLVRLLAYSLILQGKFDHAVYLLKRARVSYAKLSIST